METNNDKMWYFSYGSNMNPKVLSGRRNVHPTQSKPCFIPGWYLNFDTRAVPYIEPSFASIGQQRLDIFPTQPEVHGVLHEITHKEYEQIRRTEGGGGHENVGYTPAEVIVHTYDGQKFKAKTLVEYPVKVCHGTLYPSKRYMQLLEDGAMESGLKPSYQEWLKTVPRYQTIWSPRHIIGKTLFTSLVLMCALPLLPLLFIRIFGNKINSGSKSPRWSHVLVKSFTRKLAHIYYYVFLPVFGPGAGEPVPLDKAKLN